MAEIELFIDKSVEQNAEVYFNRAKKLKKKMEGAREALDVYQRKLEVLERKKATEKETFEKNKETAPVKRDFCS